MNRLTDAAYLRGEQYKTPVNLRARANLHERFSTNAEPWLPWVMDQIAPRPGEQVLEVGGATGGLWVTDARALADYALSMSYTANHIGRERAGELEAFFQARLDTAGGLHITKDAGLVLAWRA